MLQTGETCLSMLKHVNHITTCLAVFQHYVLKGLKCLNRERTPTSLTENFAVFPIYNYGSSIGYIAFS